MIDKPTVSVIIPCYNGSAYLKETLESVLGQSHLPLEVIVVDDGSTDDSAAIADSYGELIRVIKQKNQGESVARNRGIDEAKGDWIAFVDADDLWEPSKLQKQIKFAQPKDKIVGTHTRYLATGASLDRTQELWIPAPDSLTVNAILTNGCPVHISSLMVKRDIKARFPEWTQYGEDAIFVLSLVQEGSFAIVPEPLNIYRRHPESQSKNKNIQFLWFKSLEEWIERNKLGRSEPEVTNWNSSLLRQITNAIDISYFRRNWETYASLVSFTKERNDLDWPSFRKKRFPSVVYKIKDYFGKTGKLEQ